MEKRQRIVAAVAAGVLSVALAVGIGTASAARSATVTIHIETQATGTLPWDTINANFEKAYPNIKVEMSYVPTATYPQVLLTQLQGGNGPDLMYGGSGTGNANSLIPLARQGYLYDLSKQAWASKLPKDFDKYQNIGKARYMFPLDVPLIGIYYNPQLFSTLGLKVPTTFSQLLTLCGTINAKGYVPIAIAGAAPPNLGLTAVALAANWVYGADPNWNTKRAQGKVTFAGSPLWRDTLQHFVNMYNAHCFEPGAEGTGADPARALFATGKALMDTLTMQAYAQIKAVNPNAPVNVFTFPGTTAKTTYVPAAPTDSLAVNAHSSVLTQAVTYVNFLARTGQARLMARLQGAFSWYDYKQLQAGTLSSKDFAKAGLSWANGFLPVLKTKRITPFVNQLWPNGKIYSVLGADMQGLMTGQKTIDATLADLDAAWNAG